MLLMTFPVKMFIVSHYILLYAEEATKKPQLQIVWLLLSPPQQRGVTSYWNFYWNNPWDCFRTIIHINIRVTVIVSLPHIFIYFYNKTNEEVSSNVDNDKGGEYCRYGNVSGHVWSLSMFIVTWPNKDAEKTNMYNNAFTLINWQDLPTLYCQVNVLLKDLSI